VIEAVPFSDLGAITREVRGEVDRAWQCLLETSGFIGGEAVEAFERSWAEYCGAAYAVGVANGTDAIQLTLTALGIGPGDEVIVPANTFVASAEAIVLAGATPRFADVDPRTLLLTAEALEAAITGRTAAVLVVDLYGQMPDVDALGLAAAKAGLAFIEDAAQAHGATWHGLPAGSVGQAGCFSFYPSKNLGAFGDAGAVVTSDAQLAARLKSLRDHGRAEGSHHRHELAGTNSRLDALQAMTLTAKLPRLDAWTRARRAVAAQYRSAFAGSPVLLVEEAELAYAVYHLAVIRVPDRYRVRQYLSSMGIQTGIHYPTPCHHHPPFRGLATTPLPVVDRAADEVLSLPMFPHMSDIQVERVCEAVLQSCGAMRSRLA
jgi:dTDP-4-amino-4,6-dideoxygalactose transaminase